MSAENLACFKLTENVQRAARAKDFFGKAKLAFLASCLECEFTPDGALRSWRTVDRDEVSYFQQCWEQGADLVAEFGSEDFFFDLAAFDYLGNRYASFRITRRNLMGLVEHLESQGITLLDFLGGLGESLGATVSAIGEDTTHSVVLDFLAGNLAPEEIRDSIWIASNPNDLNLDVLKSLGFQERVIKEHKFLVAPDRTPRWLWLG